MSQVKQNDEVKVHYTGKLTTGEVFDSSLDREPIQFTMGQGQIIPGFEKGLMDMKENEEKTIEIPKAEAYGEVREDLIHEVPKEQLPQDIEPKPGMALVSRTPEGQEMNLVIKEVKDQSIVVDANHPLAGKDLIFDLKLVEIVK